MLLRSTTAHENGKESPPGRGKRRQALGWVVVRETIPTPALARHPSEGGDYQRSSRMTSGWMSEGKPGRGRGVSVEQIKFQRKTRS